ncbi:MAG: D-aminoacyl-tRNA deacylase [Myxococcota bacterium]|nr:D-aminoacyl-tRNA deacylase [Myxococcota bacterium]
MRVVLQRVSQAAVNIDGETVGAIDNGFLVLVGFTHGDGEPQIDWMVTKILGLRVFQDEDGKMNRDVLEAGGSLLVVSQFTLYGDARKGRRPSFITAAEPGEAEKLYDRFVEKLSLREAPVRTGKFGAMMDVSLVNDGPVTLMIEK